MRGCWLDPHILKKSFLLVWGGVGTVRIFSCARSLQHELIPTAAWCRITSVTLQVETWGWISKFSLPPCFFFFPFFLRYIVFIISLSDCWNDMLKGDIILSTYFLLFSFKSAFHTLIDLPKVPVCPVLAAVWVHWWAGVWRMSVTCPYYTLAHVLCCVTLAIKTWILRAQQSMFTHKKPVPVTGSDCCRCMLHVNLYSKNWAQSVDPLGEKTW